MPSFQIHLAIAKRYIEKYKIEDVKKFIEGNLAPDFVVPKSKSHYSIEHQTDDLVESTRGKVNIEKFLAENEIKTDYDKGVLLHLLSDKIFFTEFFDIEYLKNTKYEDFCKNLYDSYDKSNDYLKEKYPITLEKELADKIQQNLNNLFKLKEVKEKKKVKNILPKEKLNAFIERMSDIKLEEYYTKCK